LEAKLRKVYNTFEVPIEVRKSLAPVIEAVSSDDDLSQEDMDAEGSDLYEQIMQELQKQMRDKPFPDNSALSETTEKFQTKFKENPILLVHHIRTCLVQEGEVIASSKNMKLDSDARRKVYQEKCGRVKGAMDVLVLDIQKCDRKLKDLSTHTTHLLQSLEEIEALKGKQSKKTGKDPLNKTDHQKKGEMEIVARQQQVNEDTNELNRYKQDCENILVDLCDQTLLQIEEAWNCISLYEKEQKFSVIEANMGPPEGALKELNDMCEVVNDVLILLTQLFTIMSEIHLSFDDDERKALVQERYDHFTDMFVKHLKRIILIDVQPSQVMKVSKGRGLKFNMSLRILGPSKLGLNVNRPVVTANLHAEKDLAKELERHKPVSQGITLQGAEKIEARFDNSTKQLKVNFNTQISHLKRTSDSRSRDERVTEHKYGMIFSVTLLVAGKEHLVKKLSLPIILTTQSSQEWAAKGTLIWDAAFSEDHRTFYEDASCVKWQQLAELINLLFRESTNRALTKDNLDYLAERIFGDSEHGDYSQCDVRKDKFMKERLDGCGFSLWNWVYACLNLIKHNLSKEWEKGLIMGFVSRNKATELLERCDNDTFLLRFKGSEISGSQSAHNTAILAASAVVFNGGNTKQVCHWDKLMQSSSKKTLTRQLMSCQISNPENKELKGTAFKILYPDIPFNEAFGEFMDEEETRETDGYDGVIEKIELQLSNMNVGERSIPSSPARSSFSETSMYSDGGSPPEDSDIMDTLMSLDLPVVVEMNNQLDTLSSGDQLTALMNGAGIDTDESYVLYNL